MNTSLPQQQVDQRVLNALAAMHIEYIPVVVEDFSLGRVSTECNPFGTVLNPSESDMLSDATSLVTYADQCKFYRIGPSKGTYEVAMITAKQHLSTIQEQHFGECLPAVLVVFEGNLQAGMLWRECCLHGLNQEKLFNMPISRDDFVEDAISYASVNQFRKPGPTEPACYEIVIMRDESQSH